ncbi:MAG: hypothetical protein ACLR7U_05100 [Ruthenibacterium lactatiformans]
MIPEVPYDLERDVIAKMKATQTGSNISSSSSPVAHAQDLARSSPTGIDSALRVGPCAARRFAHTA